MKQYLDANGLNRYHTSFKDDIDASYNGLKYSVDSSFGQMSQRVEDGFDTVDSSIADLILSDIGLANAIETLVNERDRKYESLSDKIDNLTENSLLVSLSVSPTTIFVGDSSTLVFSAKSKDSASSIIITDDNGTQIASGSGTSLVGSTTVTPSSEGVLGYSVTAVVNGTTLSAKSYVNCVRPIYYGSGTNYTDATIVAGAKQVPNGKYTISVNSANNYIYFVVPSSMTIAKVLMNGLSMPMQATSVQKDGQSYTAYQSVNGYDVGTYNLDVE
jgi:hypothetical protein